MQTCKTCFRAVDATQLPTVTYTIAPRGGLPGFVQEDRNCPGCGSLVLRSIDGQPVGSDFKDDRPAKAARAEAAAAAAAAKAKPPAGVKAKAPK